MVESMQTGLVWLVVIVLIEAAIIDGWKLKVPNWLTFNLIGSGLLYAGLMDGWVGLGWSLLGAGLGLLLLLPLYAIGGMGSGDVKLMAGIGAWFGLELTLWAFVVGGILGGVIALGQMVLSGRMGHHLGQIGLICQEIFQIRDPEKIAKIADERKPRMLLLPYGIPIVLGTIGTLAWRGMLT